MNKTIFVFLLLLTPGAFAIPSKAKPLVVPSVMSPESVSLYSWREADGSSSYALLECPSCGTSLDAITSHRVPLATLERQIMNSKNGTRIIWNEISNARLAPEIRAKFVLPDPTSYNRIRELAARARLHVLIAQ